MSEAHFSSPYSLTIEAALCHAAERHRFPHDRNKLEQEARKIAQDALERLWAFLDPTSKVATAGTVPDDVARRLDIIAGQVGGVSNDVQTMVCNSGRLNRVVDQLARDMARLVAAADRDDVLIEQTSKFLGLMDDPAARSAIVGCDEAKATLARAGV